MTIPFFSCVYRRFNFFVHLLNIVALFHKFFVDTYEGRIRFARLESDARNLYEPVCAHVGVDFFSKWAFSLNFNRMYYAT